MRSIAIVVFLTTPFLLGTAQIAPTPGCSLEASASPIIAELPKLKKRKIDRRFYKRIITV